MIIETTADLEAVCRRFAAYPYVTIDTEFMREKTYYPEVCLIQIASRDEAFCIDPLAPDMNLTPLFELMQNQNVVKVFHAARQDIEILFYLSGKLPHPVFDTQIGAMVCGFPENVAYSQLVQHVTKVTLDKSMRCTNWAKRPLSEEQIQYALYDVTYLRDVYEYMCGELAESGRLSWIQEELNLLTDESTYHPTPEQILERLRYPITKTIGIHVYQHLYLWREKQAQLKNYPRRFILKDELMQEIALVLPKTQEQMASLRGSTKNFSKSSAAQEILEIVNKTLAGEMKNFPLPKQEKTVRPAEKNLLEVLKLALNIVAKQEKVAPTLIAHADDLLHFIRAKKSPLQTGWRYEIFGQKVQQFCDGHMCVRYNPELKKAEFAEIR